MKEKKLTLNELRKKAVPYHHKVYNKETECDVFVGSYLECVREAKRLNKIKNYGVTINELPWAMCYDELVSHIKRCEEWKRS